MQNIGEKTDEQTMTAEGREQLRSNLISGVAGEGTIDPPHMSNNPHNSFDGAGNRLTNQAKIAEQNANMGGEIN